MSATTRKTIMDTAAIEKLVQDVNQLKTWSGFEQTASGIFAQAVPDLNDSDDEIAGEILEAVVEASTEVVEKYIEKYEEKLAKFVDEEYNNGNSSSGSEDETESE